MTTALRDDFDAQGLRVLARQSKHAGQARRLLALAAIYEGGRRSDAARIGGVTLQIVRDWVVKFNARGPAGLIDGKGPGQPSLLNDAQRAALAAVVESGPIAGGAWRGAVATGRSVPLGVGHVPDQHLAADDEPRAPRDGLPQALRATAPSWAGRRSDRAF